MPHFRAGLKPEAQLDRFGRCETMGSNPVREDAVQRENKVVSRVAPLLCLALTLAVGACAGDLPPSPSDGQPAQEQTVTPDGPKGAEAGSDGTTGPCNDGDKRCEGLTWVQICQNGTWVNDEDCSQKDYNGNPCTCSITMMYKCTFGTHVCQ
jgi:hypothetical protein